MPCYFPLECWRVEGQSKLVFNKPRRDEIERLQVPCGQCIGCRLERSRQWAVRCLHEASLWPKNCFITLTYASEHLPPNGSLRLRDFQLFMKRLRKKYGDGIRFFHCGEYGSKFSRPHYHACLFNHAFDDKYLWQFNNGVSLYRSPALEELWPYGYSTVGDVTFESAAYVARYVLKKVTGDNASDHYSFIDPDGLVCSRAPEYVTMSRRPGIAAGWYERFSSDVYPSDKVIVRGKPQRPPRFYDERLKLASSLDYEAILWERHLTARKSLDNQTEARLAVRHEVKRQHLSKLVRKFEDSDNG